MLLYPPPVLLADYSGEAKGRNVILSREGRTGAPRILHGVPNLVKFYFLPPPVPILTIVLFAIQMRRFAEFRNPQGASLFVRLDDSRPITQ